MRARAAFLVWLGVGMCGTTLASNACTIARACTLIGCSDTESLSFTVPVAQVLETDVIACREQDCWHGHLARDVLTTGGSIELKKDDGTYNLTNATVDTHGVQPGNARLTFMFVASQDTPVQAGDLLSVTVSDSAGNTVLTHSGSVSSFTSYYPNGKDCDKVGCKSASVDAD